MGDDAKIRILLPEIPSPEDLEEMQTTWLSSIPTLYKTPKTTEEEFEAEGKSELSRPYSLIDQKGLKRIQHEFDSTYGLVMHNADVFYSDFLGKPLRKVFDKDADKYVWKSDDSTLGYTDKTTGIHKDKIYEFGWDPVTDDYKIKKEKGIYYSQVVFEDYNGFERTTDWTELPDMGAEGQRIIDEQVLKIDQKKTVSGDKTITGKPTSYYFFKHSIARTLIDSAEAGETTFDFSNVLIPLDPPKEKVKDCLIACILFGFLKDAASIDIEKNTVTFKNKTAAIAALNNIFATPKVRPDYYDSASNTLAVYTSGLDTLDTQGDDGFFNPVYGWELSSAISAASSVNSFRFEPNHLYFPILRDDSADTDINDDGITDASGLTFYMTEKAIRDQSTIMPGFKTPAGYSHTYDDDDIARFADEKYKSSEEFPFPYNLDTQLDPPVGSLKNIKILPEVMFKKDRASGTWYLAVADFFQEPNETEEWRYNRLGVKLTYAQISLLASAVGRAQQQYGFGTSVRTDWDTLDYKFPPGAGVDESLEFSEKRKIYLQQGGAELVAEPWIEHNPDLIASLRGELKTKIDRANELGKNTVELLPGFEEIPIKDAEFIYEASGGALANLCHRIYQNIDTHSPKFELVERIVGALSGLALIVAIFAPELFKTVIDRICELVPFWKPKGVLHISPKIIEQERPPQYVGQDTAKRKLKDAFLQIAAHVRDPANHKMPKSIVILGEKGQGKTALFFAVLWEFSQSNPADYALIQPYTGSVADWNAALGIIGADTRIGRQVQNHNEARSWRPNIPGRNGIAWPMIRKRRVLWIDEMHALAAFGDTGGGSSSEGQGRGSRMLDGWKPRVIGRHMMIIGASTRQEYARARATDSAFFEDRFQTIELETSTPDDIFLILKGLAREVKNRRTYTDEALRYIQNNYRALFAGYVANRGVRETFLLVDAYMSLHHSDLNNIDVNDLAPVFQNELENVLKAGVEGVQAEIEKELGDLQKQGIRPDALGLFSAEDFARLMRTPTETWADCFERNQSYLEYLKRIKNRAPGRLVSLLRPSTGNAASQMAEDFRAIVETQRGLFVFENLLDLEFSADDIRSFYAKWARLHPPTQRSEEPADEANAALELAREDLEISMDLVQQFAHHGGNRAAAQRLYLETMAAPEPVPVEEPERGTQAIDPDVNAGMTYVDHSVNVNLTVVADPNTGAIAPPIILDAPSIPAIPANPPSPSGSTPPSSSGPRGPAGSIGGGGTTAGTILFGLHILSQDSSLAPDPSTTSTVDLGSPSALILSAEDLAPPAATSPDTAPSPRPDSPGTTVEDNANTPDPTTPTPKPN